MTTLDPALICTRLTDVSLVQIHIHIAILDEEILVRVELLCKGLS